MDKRITASWTIGLDLSDKTTEACVLDAAGEVVARLPASSAEAFAKRVRAVAAADLFAGLETLLAMTEQLTTEIRRMDRKIEPLCDERYPETRILRQVKGVGPNTALAFVRTLEDPHRFAAGARLSAGPLGGAEPGLAIRCP